MATKPPPPAYSGDKAPSAFSGNQALPTIPGPALPTIPSGPPAQQATGQTTNNRGRAYWSYWGFLLTTPVIWVFAVSAAASDTWIADESLHLEDDCDSSFFGDICDKFSAAQAFQYMATILASVIIVLVPVAAFMAAPVNGRLGLAAGVMLAVFSLFQLIAFSLMAEVIKELDALWYYDLEPGPAFALAVVAWILSMAAAITVLVLWRWAARDQDGPFRSCCCKPLRLSAPTRSNATGTNMATPTAPPQFPVVGTV